MNSSFGCLTEHETMKKSRKSPLLIVSEANELCREEGGKRDCARSFRRSL